MRVVLLDMDGVILRHPKAITHVSRQCVHYVAQKLVIDHPSAYKLNKLLYQRFGHTLLGLERLYDYDLEKTVPEFNDYVYPSYLLGHIVWTTKEDPIWTDMRKDLAVLLDACDHQGIPVHVFSNAPEVWCRMALSQMNVDPLRFGSILSSGDAVVQCSLKPQKVVYKKVRKHLETKYGVSDLDLYFIDDSFHNLVPVMDQPKWRAIHMDKDKLRTKNHYLTSIHTLRDLTELI